MKEHFEFALKVAAVILVINQIPPIAAAVSKNYFAQS